MSISLIKKLKKMKIGIILGFLLIVISATSITIGAILISKYNNALKNHSKITIKASPELDMENITLDKNLFYAAKFNLKKNKVYNVLTFIKGTIAFNITNDKTTGVVTPSGKYTFDTPKINGESQDPFISNKVGEYREWKYILFTKSSSPDNYDGALSLVFPIIYSSKDNALYIYSTQMVLTNDPTDLAFKQSSIVVVNHFSANLILNTESVEDL